MDVESPSQGSDRGDADPPKPAANMGAKISAGFRHHLPQIPLMNMGHKIAQSKASAKQDNRATVPTSQQPETTQLHIEGTGKIVEISGTGRQEEIFTPPETESSSNSSPGDSKPAKNGSAKDRLTGTPIKLRIRRANRDGELDLSSCVDEAPQNIDNSFNESRSADSLGSAENPEESKITSPKTPSTEKRGKKKKVASGSQGATPTAPVQKTLKVDDGTPKWLVGDLVWSKVSGHPWWPCMVSYDPYEGVYTKLRTGKSYRLYHVQFFGDEGERGWVSDNATMPFEGKKQLEDYFKSMQLKATPKQRAQYKLDISSRRRRAWDIAWQAAEEAIPLSKAERKQKYTYSYDVGTATEADNKISETSTNRKNSEEDTGTGRTKTKAKLKKALITARTSRLHGQATTGSATPSSEDGVNGESTSKRGRKRKQTQYAESESESEEEEEPSPRRKRKRRDSSPADLQSSGKKSNRTVKNDGSFEVFCDKHRENVLLDNPTFDETTLSEYLQQQWEMMDSKQKSRYRSKLGSKSSRIEDDNEETQKEAVLVKKSGRVSKPSLKKAEAEEEKSTSTPSRRLSRKSSDNSLASNQEENTATETMTSVDVPPEDSCQSAITQKKPDNRVVIPQDDEYVDLEIYKLSGAGPTKKENVCQLCERVGELISCEGPCVGSFHINCLGLNKTPESSFKCDECTSGIHTCFSCEKSSADTKRCSIPQCGKFYHEACVKGYSLTRPDPKGFICPLHTCATCAAENPKSGKNNKGRLFRCVRCPVAYHVGDFCIAAGSIPLAGYNIVCSRHFQPVKTQNHHTHVNVSWCFICNKGGTLLCCESCPAAFHETCLKIEKPEGNWYCHGCSIGKRPLYGDVIWIKLGNYRWWPGEICHPKNVPTNIQEKAHQVGEFPVKFLGSYEYFWIHQGRVFLFQEGDKGSKDFSNSKGLAKVFSRALKQGSKAFRMWKASRDSKAQQDMEKNDKKPAPYKLIKANIPCGNVQIYKPDMSQLPRCECKANQENPCGPDSECVNRMLMYECHPAVCPAGEKCLNQRFQKRQYPESVPFRASQRGWGLKTLVDIKRGEFVNEYVGELVDEEECRRRIQKAHEDNITNFYMLTIDKNRIIDAGPKGNYSRFMNHSCQPNLETQKWTINGEVRVGLFAAQDIPAGSELTFNYNLDCLGNEKTICACGAPICSGFLGVPPKTSAAAANEKRAKEMKKRKKKKPKVDVKKEHDDLCFRCGEGGELVMCDKVACPRVYHLQCLNLAKPPHGKWVCPWHHCDECGKPSAQLCSECPNSFCTGHLEDRMFTTQHKKLICLEHEDLLATLMVTKVDPTEVKEPVDTDKGSTNGESGVTDSDSHMSSEDSDKPRIEAKVKPPSKVMSLKRKSMPETPSETKEVAVSRTGRKIKKRSLDSLEMNGVEETKPKSAKQPKKQTQKSKTLSENTMSNVNCLAASTSSAKDKPSVHKAHPSVGAVKDSPMFDDSDDEGLGGLVIDIPAI